MHKYVILLLCISNGIWAQEANRSVEKNSIQANFSLKALEAYQENSVAKVNDFYDFLQLYSDDTTSEALKNQVKENIYSLLRDKITMVLDVTDTAHKNKVTIEVLLEKVKNKNLKFKAQNIQKSNAQQDFWHNRYILEIKKGEEIKSLPVTHKIYFYPYGKQFGENTKTVWQILLGEIN